MVDISRNKKPELKDLERYIDKWEDGIDKTMFINVLNSFKNDFNEKEREKTIKNFCDTLLEYSKEYPYFFCLMEAIPSAYRKEGIRMEIVVSEKEYKG